MEEAKIATGAGIARGSTTFPGLPPTVAPFLIKCYDVVDDPSTDIVVSWGDAGNSFVIWDPYAFSRDLLPKYFKHGNLTSFIRQLNIYGFRKINPDRLEFANEGFLRGQMDLLKSIRRRKSSHQQQHEDNITQLPHTEIEKFALDKEIEILKRDKDVLMQEILELRQQQQNSDIELHSLRQQIQFMEKNQQNMMSFLVMLVQCPSLFVQLMQQNLSNRWTEVNKKRQLPAQHERGIGSSEQTVDGQMIKYQPITENLITPLVPEANSNMLDSMQPISSMVNHSCTDPDVASAGANISFSSEVSVTDYFEQLLASPELESAKQIDPQTLADFMNYLALPED